MMMSELLKLAERCEAATGPDRELDSDIGRVTGAWKTQPSFASYRPTASLDAAMSLVPDGMHVAFERTIVADNSTICNADVWGREGRPDDWMSEAATPALALCAAALRARATLTKADAQ